MSQHTFWKIWERFGLLVLIIALAVYLSCSSENFLTTQNFINFLNQAAIVVIIASGMTLVIASGGFDLSVGSVFALAACVGAKTVVNHSVFTAIIAALIVALVLGIINGLIITRLKVPTFIATLAMMAIVRGVVLIYTGGREIILFFDDPAKESAFKFFGGGFVFSLPFPLVLMAVILVIFFLILKFTPFGRHICAVGSNELSAVTSGLNVPRIKIAVFALVGLTAGIAAVIQTSQLVGVSGSTSGLGLELEAISVVVLGGTSLAGGRGKLFGTMLAAILVAMANNGLNLHSTPIFYQYLVLGLILMLAVSLDGLRRRFYQPAGIWAQR